MQFGQHQPNSCSFFQLVSNHVGFFHPRNLSFQFIVVTIEFFSVVVVRNRRDSNNKWLGSDPTTAFYQLFYVDVAPLRLKRFYQLPSTRKS